MRIGRIMIFVVVAAVCMAGVWACRARKAGTNEARGRQGATVKVRRGDLRVSVSASGSVIWSERIPVRPPVAGRVDEVLVLEGQPVARGAKVAVLSSRERAMLLDAARSGSQADAGKWEDVYRPISILSPADGKVLGLAVKPGQLVAPETALFAVAGKPVIRVFVEETDLAGVVAGRNATVTFEARPGTVLTGSVSRIAGESIQYRNAIAYEVEIAGAIPPEVLAGMSVNAEFVSAERRAVLLLPQSAIIKRNGHTFVLRPAGDGPHEALAVRAGLSDGTDVEIIEGVGEGETVLADAEQRNKTETALPSSPLIPFTRAQ